MGIKLAFSKISWQTAYLPPNSQSTQKTAEALPAIAQSYKMDINCSKQLASASPRFSSSYK
jgi:hypothetical protein